MKRLLFTFALVLIGLSASAQFVVSANIGGAYSLGNNTLHKTYNDSVTMDANNINDKPLSVTGGIKFGYQTGRVQFGVAGSFTWSHTTIDMPQAIYPNGIPTADYKDYVGWRKIQATSWQVAPYIRIEMLQAGDIALFAELSGYYGVSNNPSERMYADFYFREVHHTDDTTFDIQRSGRSYGAQLTPGLSWQLTPHCHVDLYLDFLSFWYQHSETSSITVVDEMDNTSFPPVVQRRTVTTVNSSYNDMGFGLTGSTVLSDRNWVRVGFSLTF